MWESSNNKNSLNLSGNWSFLQLCLVPMINNIQARGRASELAAGGPRVLEHTQPSN